MSHSGQLRSNMNRVLKNTEMKYRYNIKGISKKDDLRRLSERVTKLEKQLKKLRSSTVTRKKKKKQSSSKS